MIKKLSNKKRITPQKIKDIKDGRQQTLVLKNIEKRYNYDTKEYEEVRA